MSVRSWKIVAAVALASAALLASAAGLWALSAQAGPFMWSAAAGFAESHDKRAFRLLERSKGAQSLDAAADEVGRALALSPYSNPARLRLAYIDVARYGSLQQAGLAQFARSYDLAPYDHTIAGWRIRFGLEHWQSLSPELRTAVHAEAIAFGKASSSDVDVRGILQTIHDPAGRLAGELWLRELSMQAQLLESRSHSPGNRP